MALKPWHLAQIKINGVILRRSRQCPDVLAEEPLSVYELLEDTCMFGSLLLIRLNQYNLEVEVRLPIE